MKLKKEVQITEDNFYDILFDNTKNVVEKHSERTGWHLTTLVVDGVVKAWREITASGVIFMGYEK